MSLKPIQEMQQLLPPLAKDDYERLRADIATRGIQIPILRGPDGGIIDGAHRFQIAREIGLKEEDIPIKESSARGKDAIRLGLALNLARRHLTPEQKREVRAKLRSSGWTQQEVAQVLGIDRSSVSKGEKASNVKIHNACATADLRLKVGKRHRQEIVERVKAGEKQEQVAADYGITRQRVSQLVQREKRREAPLSPNIPDWDGSLALDHIYPVGIAELHKVLPAESVDLICTDPPYDEEHLGLYGELASLAALCLKPGRHCLVYAGKMYLPDILQAMGESLEYVWTMAVFHPFSQARVERYHIFENWRPILVFKKAGAGPPTEWVQDVIRGTRDKEYHPWQQDEEAPRQYISVFTKPGDLVLDPFVGGGTVPAVCKALGRHFLGFDKDETSVRVALQRLNECQT